MSAGLGRSKTTASVQEIGAKCHTAALHYRPGVFKEGAGQTPFRTDSVTQGERERIKPVFVVFSQWTDWEGEGKSSRGHNHRQGTAGVPPPAREGGEDRVG